MYVGAFFAYLALPFIFKCSEKTIGVLDTILFTVPIAIDGVLQLYGLGWRNNWTRFLTGVLASSNIIFFIIPIFLNLIGVFDIEVKLHNSNWFKLIAYYSVLVFLVSLFILILFISLNNFIGFIILSIFLTYYVILHNIVLPVAAVIIVIKYALKQA
mgnify:CR=1 FL=1